ncbi:hypothetical protein DPMN_165064 [Dreissena polymorpha]|uniref:Uncharacterized protein n=1 Tax=Dreissena polymorpha TaxID=45954 RepID=A0A9D4EW48_DREPO|nr:hypothetical protein DPMN_165064 [Dreissena polymorpha]
MRAGWLAGWLAGGRNKLRNRLGEATLESLIILCLHTERLGEKEVTRIIDKFAESPEMLNFEHEHNMYIDHDWQMTPIDFQVTRTSYRARFPTPAPLKLACSCRVKPGELIEFTKYSDDNRKLKLGELLFEKIKGQFICILPVLASSPSKEAVVDTERIMKDALFQWTQFTARKCESVAIHASVYDEHVCFVADYLNHFLKASLQLRKLHIYICCSSKDDVQ